jgi:hypothetical protein
MHYQGALCSDYIFRHTRHLRCHPLRSRRGPRLKEPRVLNEAVRVKKDLAYIKSAGLCVRCYDMDSLIMVAYNLFKGILV